MLNKFTEFVSDNQLFQRDEKVLLAVSGGIDSVVMAYLFYKSGFRFSIAHCNFNLRGDESNEDDNFVKKIASEVFSTEYYNIRFETTQYAKKQKLSIQQAARKLRYDWFEEIRSNYNYSYIATGHNLDDQIETFFINLLRGTGISGLTGIPLKADKIIRPLLFTSRGEIELFAKLNNISFRNDSSNKSNKYLRNKLRNKLIPLLNEINPSFRTTITHSIQNLKRTAKIYYEFLQSLDLIKKVGDDKTVIEISRLKQLNPSAHYLYELISEFGFNLSTCADINKCLDGISGKKFYSNTHVIVRDREYLIIYPKTNIMEESNEIILDLGVAEIFNPFHLKFSELENVKDQKLNYGEKVAMLNMDRLVFPLTIRKWQQGDFFYPLGLKSKKKLSDFFIDNKLSLKEKSEVWLLCSCGEIVWVIGYRIDERFKVQERTKSVFKIEII